MAFSWFALYAVINCVQRFASRQAAAQARRDGVPKFVADRAAGDDAT
jgi:hypothetical protein